MTSRVARVLPSDYLGHRVTVLPDNLASLVEDVDGGEPPEALVRVARRNPGLGLEEVLAGPGAARTKTRTIERLVGLVAETWSRNPGTNLLALDHSPDSADMESLKLPDVDDDDREKILANLRAQQRAFLAGGNAGTGLKLLDSGFDAARKIIALNPDEFVEASGLPPEEAVAVHYAATKASTDAAVKSAAVYQLVKSQAPAPTRTSSAARDFIAQIPGYRTLFPDGFAFCDCEDCGSVLGLPAYFVDLMFFVEQHILDYLPPNLSIHLKARRDDLWSLDLTCKNANDVVAYLDVVNEILEKHVSKQLGLAAGADVWERIAEKNPSFTLPFNLPLTRIETYLGHFGKRRLDAAVACGSDETVRARARLGLSKVEAEMIEKPAAANFTALTAAEMTFLSKLYGYLNVYQNGGVETSGFSIVFVSNVLDATGASREEVGDLLATMFVGGTAAPTIRAGRSTAQSLQNDTEVIEGLKAGHLDRLHRLYRLSRHVPWTIPELDRTLDRLTAKGLSSGLGDTALLRIARLLGHQEQLGLSVEELCGLWTELPNDPLDGGPGFFDSLFNPPQLASLGTPLAYTSTPQGSFQHPSFNTTGTSLPQDENTLARLLAGIRVSDEELVQLLLKLALPLGLSADKKLKLSIRNLTLLYRHAMLARCLGLTVAGLFQLLETARLPVQTAGGQTARPIRDWSLDGTNLVDDLGTVLETHLWTSESGFTADEIAFITGGLVVDETTLVAGEKRADDAAVIDTVVTQLLADRAFEFADTVLSGMPNGADQDHHRRRVPQDHSGERRALRASAGPGQRSGSRRRSRPPTSRSPCRLAAFALTAAEVAAELTKHSIHTLLGAGAREGTRLLRGEDNGAASPQWPGRNAELERVSRQLHRPRLRHVDGPQRAARRSRRRSCPMPSCYRDELYDETTLDAIYRDRASFAVDVRPLEPEAVRLATLVRPARHRARPRVRNLCAAGGCRGRARGGEHRS